MYRIKLLALTDIHDRIKYVKLLADKLGSIIPDPDLVVIAGDITHFGSKQRGLNVLTRIYKILGEKPVFFVPGNCDSPDLLDVKIVDNHRIYNLHANRVVWQGFVLYGIGGSNYTPFSTMIEWSEDRIHRFLVEVEDVEKERLIMVTHAPIYGVMDEIKGKNIGSKALRNFLDKHGALLWITGHLHEYSGYKYVSGTYVVNPGPLMRGYYGYITISEKGSVDIEIRNVLETK